MSRQSSKRFAQITTILQTGFVVLITALIGCDPAGNSAGHIDSNNPPPATESASPTDNTSTTSTESSSNSVDNQSAGQTSSDQDSRSPFRMGADGKPQIAIGTFNIQSLGRTKISKPEVTKVLVDIIRRFDVIAIQELRDVNQSTIPELLKMVNANGLNFNAIVGPRQGYIVNTGRAYAEQAVFIYDTNTIEPISDSYVAEDINRVMHRAPFVAQFRCRTPGQFKPFTFTLLNVHVDPDEVATELPAMVNIVRGTFANHNEDDFIVLGDLNATPERISIYPWLENQIGLISNSLRTNTAMSRTIDNIVLDHVRTSEFQRQAGVMDLHEQYSLTHEEALKVSDHMPVWAMFSAYEDKPTTASPSQDNLPIPGSNATLERTTRLPGQTNPQSSETAR